MDSFTWRDRYHTPARPVDLLQVIFHQFPGVERLPDQEIKPQFLRQLTLLHGSRAVGYAMLSVSRSEGPRPYQPPCLNTSATLA